MGVVKRPVVIEGDDLMSNSNIPSFHKLSVPERVRAARDHGLLSSRDYKALLNGHNVLDLNQRRQHDRECHWRHGSPGWPRSQLPDQRASDYVVPLAVEEPSIVAGLSHAAKDGPLSGRLRDLEHRTDSDRPDPARRCAAPHQGAAAARAAQGRGTQPRQQPPPADGGARRRRD